jgi:hypothetical protein
MKIGWVVVPVVFLVAGCATATDPGVPLPPADLPVTVQGSPVNWDRNPLVVEGDVGSVRIRDRAITGRCHRDENHGAYRDGDEIVFWIAHTGAAAGEVCQAIGVIVSYEAVVGGVEPGEQRVRVDYIGQIGHDGDQRDALRSTVTVR